MPLAETTDSEAIISILTQTLEALQEPETITQLQAARDKIGNEMMKMMQFLFPVVMAVQLDVLQREECVAYGYGTGKEGLIRFVRALKTVERDDPEVARLHGLVRAYYLPPVAVNVHADSFAEDVINSC